MVVPVGIFTCFSRSCFLLVRGHCACVTGRGSCPRRLDPFPSSWVPRWQVRGLVPRNLLSALCPMGASLQMVAAAVLRHCVCTSIIRSVGVLPLRPSSPSRVGGATEACRVLDLESGGVSSTSSTPPPNRSPGLVAHSPRCA